MPIKREQENYSFALFTFYQVNKPTHLTRYSVSLKVAFSERTREYALLCKVWNLNRKQLREYSKRKAADNIFSGHIIYIYKCQAITSPLLRMCIQGPYRHELITKELLLEVLDHCIKDFES